MRSKILKSLIVFVFVIVIITQNYAQFILQENENELDSIYSVVDEMARFPGCERPEISAIEKMECSNMELMDYIYSHIKYPLEAREQKVEGRVVVQFVVTKEGEIGDVNILRDIGAGCGESVRELIKNMNAKKIKWTPGKKDGNLVDMYFTVPVKFRLSKYIDKNAMYKNSKPRFPGCEDGDELPSAKKLCADQKMKSWIYERLKYPEEALAKNIEGELLVYFLVTKEGFIKDIGTTNDIGGGTSFETIRVILEMNQMKERWIPAMSDGKPVDRNISFPIKFYPSMKK